MGRKTAIITGATSGIGKATAAALGKAGFNLILTGRNEQKGNLLTRNINKKYGVTAEFLKADISSISDVKSFCETVKEKYDNIDVLLNNAGARFQNYFKSKDGIELTFATNYVGHFILTLSLLDLLKKSHGAKIINVSSGAHWKASPDINNIANPSNYDRRKAYGQSKLALILFTHELSEKLNGTNITVNALDPGGVATNLGRNNGLVALAKHYMSYILRGTLVSPATAADAIVYLSTSDEIKNISGKYFFRKEMTKSSEVSYDNKSAEELWNLSLKICGLTFN